MRYPSSRYLTTFLILFLFISMDNVAQRLRGEEVQKIQTVRPYLNAGYVMSLTPGCTDCNKDSGGSLRFGILLKGKFGFHAGYIWYNVDHYQVTDYEDKDSAVELGGDFLLWGRTQVQGYLLLGVAMGKQESHFYNTNRVETESIVRPQIGAMFHIKRFNAYIGSGIDRFNVGLGITI